MVGLSLAPRMRAFWLIAFLFLVSCGGGGNDFPESSPPAAPADPGSGTNTPATTPPPPPPTGISSDTQDPAVLLLLPLDDTVATGTISLRAEASDNVGVAGVQFRVDSRALGGMITTSPYSTDFDTTYLSDGEHTFTARAYDAAGNDAISAGNTVVVSNSCKTASRAVTQWQNSEFAAQSGQFTAQWDVTPLGNNIDGVLALARGAQRSWTGLSAVVRFTPANTIDALNDNTYSAVTPMTYAANTTYHIRMTVDVVRDIYSVYVTPAGGTEQLLAQDFAFRANRSSLDHWIVEAESTNGALRACNFSVSAAPPTTANAPPTTNAGPPQTVTERTTVALTGTATDSDGTIAAIQWIQIAPPAPMVTINNANTLNASFVAPDVTAPSVFRFRLTVTDNGGATAAATTDITVNDTAPPPPPAGPTTT